MRFFTAAFALFASSSMAATICPSGSNAQCCSSDILSPSGLDCKNREFRPL